MEGQLSPRARQCLDRFCRQYLQVQLDLDYPDAEHLRSDAFQQSLYTRLFQENAIEHAPPLRYQLRALKGLTKRIEQSIQDWEEEGISDHLMNSLSSHFSSSIPSEAAAARQKSFVTYTISCLPSKSKILPTITLFEARNLVAASGTTGLRTWEAALHLGNYLSANADGLVQGKSILELGAGTGYVSILCAKYLGASHVIATDGSEDVVASLSTNYYLNNLQDVSTVEVKELKWGQALLGSEDPEWNAGRQIDLVMGADLTYDGSGVPALVATFGDLFELHPKVKIIIADPIRNEKTFKTFLNTCRLNKYLVDEVQFGVQPPGLQEGPFYSDQVPIQLCVITKDVTSRRNR